jgi:hypothetical protein
MASAVSALSWAPTQAGLLASVIDPTSHRMLLVHALAAARATPAWQNPAMRPFRFLATVEEFVDFAELTSLARQAEATGCSALVMPDHLIKQHAALPLLAMVAATEEKIGWIRAAAGDRFGDLELNTYPVGGPMVVTSDPCAEAGRRADRIRQPTGVELTVEEILDSPHVFIGSVKDLTAKFADLRERFGISSFLIDDLDALAPVVEELAGQ